MIKTQRTVGLDFLKYLCSFLVIIIHSEMTTKADLFVLPITRIAVPIFFMITGYFYTGSVERNRTGKQIKKIFGLIIFSNALYFVWDILKTLLKNGSVTEYLKSFLSWEKWVDFLVFNKPPHKGSLWYLTALLYVLIIMYFLKKMGLKSFRKLYILIPILLAFNLVLGNYAPLIFGKNLKLVYSRNFLFAGIPFFLLGDYIYHKKFEFKNKTLITCIIIFAITSVLENWYMVKIFKDKNLDFFASTLFISFFVFIFALKNEKIFAEKTKLSTLAEFGRKYSLIIYIAHPIVINIWTIALNLTTKVFGRLSVLHRPLSYIEPIIFLAASTFIAWFIGFMQNKIKKKNQRSK